jgi:hypothetical protein
VALFFPPNSGLALTPVASGTQPVIVIGFVGGFVRHDSAVRGGVQLAARLRANYPSDLYVEVFENRRRGRAHAEILRLLDANKDGTLDEKERENARIIIYGISWGGSETATLAQELEKEGIPVLLTVQVDSVAKLGEHDGIIPANVAQAVNFYQHSGWLHGRSEIRAADATRTQILGNFRFDYKASPLKCENYPWYSRVFTTTHVQIECDPKVWEQIESLIRKELPHTTAKS